MNWEARYRELDRKVTTVIMPLLTRALAYVPEPGEKSKNAEETQYVDEIAPRDSNLPVIMTMCTPAERKEAIRLVNQRIDEQGRWIHGRKKERRPAITMITQRSREEQEAGNRSNKKHKRQVWSATKREFVEKAYKLTSSVTLMVTHVKLIEQGEYPTEARNVASHLCHERTCITHGHFVWSSQDDNWRRERLCNLQGKTCKCGLTPPCNFTLH